jgi:ornithine carbamoyltransferase
MRLQAANLMPIKPPPRGITSLVTSTFSPMQHAPQLHKRWSLDTLPAAERQRVFDMASALERSARAGHPLQSLRGKNLAVLCEDATCPHLELFRRAAGELGAQVTHIRPSEALDVSTRAPDALGHLLGRLYDAIDCHGVASDAVERLERTTGRPVFNDLACHQHFETNEEPNFTLQALLLTALA